jgi:hypothetical protein
MAHVVTIADKNKVIPMLNKKFGSMKAWGNGGIAGPVINLGTRWR